MSSKLKLFLVQLSIFWAIFCLAELFFWAIGERPGTVRGELYPVKEFEYQALFQADSNGISSYNNQSPIRHDYVLNSQGFRSSIEFNRHSIDSIRSENGKQVVMLIGDSYTEGCCADPIEQCFADLLAATNTYNVLNFGVGATDMLQYRLVVEKYVPELLPDLVVICVFMGNDLSYNERPITPFVPCSYTIKDFAWINPIGPAELMNQAGVDYLKTPEEAYQFYVNAFTLWGDTVKWYEKLIRNSILLSRPYIEYRNGKVNQAYWKNNPSPPNQDVSVAHNRLKRIKQVCDSVDVELTVFAIPTPRHIVDGVDLKAEYEKYIKPVGLRYFIPPQGLFNESDYDGLEPHNHFNNSGHKKYYDFMERKLAEHFTQD